MVNPITESTFSMLVIVLSFISLFPIHCMQNNGIQRRAYQEVEISSTFLEKANVVGATMSSFLGGYAANALSPLFFASGVVNGLSAVIDPQSHKKSNSVLIGANLLFGTANATLGTWGLLFDGGPINIYLLTKAFINFANVGYRCYNFR